MNKWGVVIYHKSFYIREKVKCILYKFFIMIFGTAWYPAGGCSVSMLLWTCAWRWRNDRKENDKIRNKNKKFEIGWLCSSSICCTSSIWITTKLQAGKYPHACPVEFGCNKSLNAQPRPLSCPPLSTFNQPLIVRSGSDLLSLIIVVVLISGLCFT